MSSADERAQRKAERAERKALRDALRENPEARARAEKFVTDYTKGNPYDDYTDAEAVEAFEYVRAEATPAELHEALRETIKHFTPEQQAAFMAMMQGDDDTSPAMGIAGKGGPSGLGNIDDVLGGLIDPRNQTLKGGGKQAPSSPFASVLGGLLGSGGMPAPQSMPAPNAMGNDPIGTLLGGLLGGGMGGMGGGAQANDPLGSLLGGLLGGGAAPQKRNMPAQDPFAQMFGGLLGGGSGQPMGNPYKQAKPEQKAGMDSAMMKMIMGGIAAFAMKKMLSK